MATSFCPQCAAPRTGTLRYCGSCAYDFWGAAAGQPEPTPNPAPPTAPGATPDWVQQRHAATPPPVQRDSPAKVLLLVAAFLVIGIFWYIGQSNEPSTPEATPTPRPAVKHLTGTFLSWEPVDDAHGYAYFEVTNSGTTTETATCTIKVSNDFGNFGFDYLVGEPVGPGETISGRVALDVGEGSYLINEGEVTDC